MTANSSSSSFLSFFLKGTRPYFLIAIIGFFLYLPSLSFDFIQLDDTETILKNYAAFQQPSSLLQAFREDPFFSRSRPYYRPLVTVSLIVDSLLMGNTPLLPLYHFTTLMIHLIASCLIYKTLVRLRYRQDLSLFFSLLFTVHPILTPAAVIIPGRVESLVAIFILSAFLSLDSYLETKKPKALLLHTLFFFLALLTKETALVLPLLAVLYIRLIAKHLLWARHLAYLISGWAISLLFWFTLRQQAFLDSGAGFSNLFSYFHLKLFLLLQLIGKIFFPVHLSVYPHIPSGSFLPGALAICLTLFAFLLFRPSRSSHLIFGLSWFFLFLTPIFFTNFFPISLDHRVYLAFFGLIIVILEIGFFQRLKFTSHTLVVMAGLLLIFASVTYFHSKNFRNGLAFWQNAVQTNPISVTSHQGLAWIYYREGNFSQAEKETDLALELSPQAPRTHLLRGLIFASQKLYPWAEAEYHQEKATVFKDYAYAALALLYYDQDKTNLAELYWQKALAITEDRELILAYQRFRSLSQSQTKLTHNLILSLTPLYF